MEIKDKTMEEKKCQKSRTKLILNLSKQTNSLVSDPECNKLTRSTIFYIYIYLKLKIEVD